MARRRGAIGRGEIDERIASTQETAEAKEDEIEEAVMDSEVVDGARDSLEFGGTDEGAEETDQYLAEAEDAAAEIADERDTELDQILEEGKETESELDERIESDESDQERVAEAERDAVMMETLDRVKRGIEALAEDIAFLEEANDRAAREREEHEQRQEELRARIKRGH